MRFLCGFRIDLRRENGLRVWVRQGDGRGVVRFQFHHACCDGVAASQFIEDILCEYDRQQCANPGIPSVPRPLDTQSLHRRSRFGTGWRSRLWHRLILPWGVSVGTLRFFLRRPAPLRCSEFAGGPAGEYDESAMPELLTQRFTEAQLRRLLFAAGQNRVTLNTLVLRDLFLAIEAWNTLGGQQHRPLLRVMVPFNLRGPEHSQMSAANVVGMANVDRRLGAADPRLLLDSLGREMKFLRRFRLVATFSAALALIECLPGLKGVFQADRCLATAVLSNLGRIYDGTPLRRCHGKLVCGDLTVDAIDIAAPIRAGSRIACVLYTYAGELSLAMNCDARTFHPTTAKLFFDQLVEQIEQTACGRMV